VTHNENRLCGLAVFARFGSHTYLSNDQQADLIFLGPIKLATQREYNVSKSGGGPTSPRATAIY
jgi:hypothetical protein